MTLLDKIKRDAVITLSCEPEVTDVRGNAMASGDDAQDREQERWVCAQLESGNAWAWCCAVVRAEWAGLEAEETLGCCSYHSEADFKAPGGYFDDMVAAVCAELELKARRVVREAT